MKFKNEKCIVLKIEIKKNIEINKIENLKLNLKKKKKKKKINIIFMI